MATLQLSALPQQNALEKQLTTVFEDEVQLLSTYGTNSLAFLGTSPDNFHYIAPHSSGLVSYRLMNNVAVVLGDPISNPDRMEDVTKSFLEFCEEQHRHVAFYQASHEYLPIYSKLKLHMFKMGEEAYLSPQNFTLSGSSLANVRTSARRAERDEVTISWYEGVPPSEVITQIQQISQTWLKQKVGSQGGETTFSTGTLHDLIASAQRADAIHDQYIRNAQLDKHISLIPRLITGVAKTSEGMPCAFVTWTPLYGENCSSFTEQETFSQGCGWSLDLLRRSPFASPGVMELLIVKSIERSRLSGVQSMSLGLVALSDTRQQMSALEHQLLSYAFNRLHILNKRDSLFSFKQKFHPNWQSRYIVTPSLPSLPAIAFAVMKLRNYSHSSKSEH